MTQQLELGVDVPTEPPELSEPPKPVEARQVRDCVRDAARADRQANKEAKGA